MRLAACGWTVSGGQKADLEDILTHVQGETPETARLLANSMAEERRTRILTYYETMKGKLVFTPWQVAAAEALRDGDAAAAIAAHHLRGRFHIGYDEEKTLTSLVDDWDRYQRANPGKSSVVLARTRAEVRALSHLMREAPVRRTAGWRTVRYGTGDGDRQQGHGRRAGNLAAGDRTRRPAAYRATHWEKQLFNGTVVTVEGFKVEMSEAGTEPSVLISARTEDGRSVSFHHDEIRDWYGNIRLDHGLCAHHHIGPGADRRPDVPAGRCEARARDDLSRRNAPSREARHLRQPGPARPRYHRQAGRQRPGSGGDGH